jgi:FkbM family methyltransferase
MLGPILFTARRRLPDFPGRQRLFAFADRCFGPFVMAAKDGVRLQSFSASHMDAMLLDTSAPAGSDMELLDEQLEQLQPGDTFIDIGANIGLYSILAARRVGATGRVLSFEPSPREFSRLLANLALNEAGAVTPFSVALGSTPGFFDLHIAPTHTGLNTLQVSDAARHAFGGDRVQRVGVVRFDDAIAPLLAGQRAKLMKIDVEGAEMDVLMGMEKSLAAGFVDRIVVEITPKFLSAFGRTKDELYDLMERHGYAPREHRKEAPKEEWQYDELFVRK